MNSNELIECLQSQDKYKASKRMRESIMKNDINQMTLCIDTINNILGDKTGPQMTQLLAARLCKETMDLQVEEYVRMFSQRCVPKLKVIALFKHEDKSDKRGRFYFSDEPSQQEAQIGNSIFRLIQECIFVWANWYPKDPATGQISQFKKLYDSIINQGVIFPKLSYFKESDLKQNPNDIIKSNTSKEINQNSAILQQSVVIKPLMLRITDFLEELSMEIEIVGGVLDENELLTECLQVLKQRIPEAETLLLELMDSPEDPEGMLEQLIQNQELIERIVKDFAKSRVMTQDQFEARYLSTPNEKSNITPQQDNMNSHQTQPKIPEQTSQNTTIQQTKQQSIQLNDQKSLKQPDNMKSTQPDLSKQPDQTQKVAQTSHIKEQNEIQVKKSTENQKSQYKQHEINNQDQSQNQKTNLAHDIIQKQSDQFSQKQQDQTKLQQLIGNSPQKSKSVLMKIDEHVFEENEQKQYIQTHKYDFDDELEVNECELHANNLQNMYTSNKRIVITESNPYKHQIKGDGQQLNDGSENKKQNPQPLNSNSSQNNKLKSAAPINFQVLQFYYLLIKSVNQEQSAQITTPQIQLKQSQQQNHSSESQQNLKNQDQKIIKSETDTVFNHIETLEQYNSQLYSKNTQIQQLLVQIEKLNKHIDSLEQQNQQLQQKNTQVQNTNIQISQKLPDVKNIENLNNRIESLEQQNQQLSQKNTQLQNINTVLSQKLPDVKQNENLIARVGFLEEQNEQLTQKNTHLQNNNTQLSQKLPDVKNIENLNARIESLEQQNQLLSQKNTQLQKQEALNIDVLNNKILFLESHNNKLDQVQLLKTSTAPLNTEALQIRIQFLESQTTSMLTTNNQLQVTNTQLQAMNTQLQQSNSQLQATNTEYYETIVQNANMQLQKKQPDLELLKQLHERISDLESNKLELQKQIRAFQLNQHKNEQHLDLQAQSGQQKFNEMSTEIKNDHVLQMQILSDKLNQATKENLFLNEQQQSQQREFTRLLVQKEQSQNQDSDMVLHLTKENSQLLQEKKLQELLIEEMRQAKVRVVSSSSPKNKIFQKCRDTQNLDRSHFNLIQPKDSSFQQMPLKSSMFSTIEVHSKIENNMIGNRDSKRSADRNSTGARLRSNSQQPRNSYHKKMNSQPTTATQTEFNLLFNRGSNHVATTKTTTNRYSELIYPFTSPVEYFHTCKQKPIRGRIVTQQYDLSMCVDGQHLLDLKMALQGGRHALMQSSLLSIGSMMEKSKYGVMVQLVIYYFGEEICEAQLTQHCKGIQAQQSQTHTLRANHPTKLEFLYKLQDAKQLVDLPICQLDLGDTVAEFHLPVTIIQFMDFRGISCSTFKRLLQPNKEALFRSEVFQLSNASNSHQALNIVNKSFPDLIELNDKHDEYLGGIDQLKLGASFSLQGSKFLLRILLRPALDMVVQVIQYEGAISTKIIESMVNAFQFMLG